MPKNEKTEGVKEYTEKVLLREGTILLNNPKLEVSVGMKDGAMEVIVSRDGEVLGNITDVIIKITAKERSVTVKGVGNASDFLAKATR